MIIITFLVLIFMSGTTKELLALTQVKLSEYVLFTEEVFLINGTFRYTVTGTVSQCASLCSRHYNGCAGFLVPDSRCGNNTAITTGSCQLVTVADETVVYPRLGSDCKLFYADNHLMTAVITGNSSKFANFHSGLWNFRQKTYY
jgi:hypothetical protein